jgi:hypothetical protein
MSQIEEALGALVQGHSVRRETWEPTIRVFLTKGKLMCQYGAAKAWPCALSWDEIVATDWQLIEDSAVAQQVDDTIESPRLPFVLRTSNSNVA